MKIGMATQKNKNILEKSCALILLNIPKNTSVGIDLMTWQVGDKFKGIKLIPPGLHFINYRSSDKYNNFSPTCSFFHHFEENEILVKTYNTEDELIYDEQDTATVERIKNNMREMMNYLGPYPMDLWPKWISFSKFIDEPTLKRLEPLSGIVNSAPEYINLVKSKYDKCSNEENDSNSTESKNTSEDVSNCKTSKNLQGKMSKLSKNELGTNNLSTIHESDTSENTESPEIDTPKISSIDINPINTTDSDPRLPSMAPRPGTELRFSKFPKNSYPVGCSAAEISRYSLDSSFMISRLFEQMLRPEEILSELQFSFICFLLGQSMDGWDQWKKLVIEMCKAEQMIVKYPTIYTNFISILYYQIQEIPEDLFVDIVERENFIVASLRILFANIFDNFSTLPQSLVSKARKFSHHLTSKFDWNLNFIEEDEYQPMIVEN